MKVKLHKIYQITFPCGNTYVGETTQPLNKRYHSHRSDSKIGRGGELKNELCVKYIFNEVSMVVLECVEGTKRNAEVIEQKWIDKLKPTLNVKRGFNSKEDLQQYRKKQYQLKYGQLKEERNTPEHKEKKKESNRLYYIKNKEKLKEYTLQKYYNNNLDSK
tara:strand:- start:26 stop:508 length:483 start_codon:yes stop_codon:yes gene_type:complete